MLGDHLGEVALQERLGEPRQLQVGAETGRQLGVAGGEHDRQVGVAGAHHLGELDAGHLRHRVVGDHEVDLGLGGQQVERRGRGVRLDHRVAEVLQHGGGAVADQHVVVDQQDGGAGAEVGVALRGLARQLALRALGLGQQQVDAGAAARVALDAQRAAGLGGEAMHHRKAEPGALAGALGGEERLGRPGERRRVHARPVSATLRRT